MKTRMEIDTKTFVRFWLVLVGFALAILAIYSARAALIIIAVAFFLALVLNGPVHYLAGRLPGKSRVMATAVAYVVIVAGLIGFTVLIVPPIIQQTSKFIQTIPDISTDAIEQWNGIGSLVDRYGLQAHIDSAVDSLQESASGWAANAGRNVIAGAESLVSFVFASFLVLVLTFLMLVEGPTWLRRVWGLYNNSDQMEHHQELASQMYRVVNGYIMGQLAVAAIGGVFAGLAVFILSFFFDLPGNLALPTFAITAILSLIPMFGATLAGGLVTLLIAFNSLSAAIIYVTFFIIYQQIENNFVSPAIQARRLELSALSVLVATTIGFYVFGIFGSLISIPVAGCIKVLLEDYLKRAHKKRTASRNPITKLANKKA